MEMDVYAAENNSAEDAYVFLDFNGKLSNEVLQNQVFLRVENLHKKNPLIQVNDCVFKGTYDECVGTNLFFDEVDDSPPPGNAFEKQTQINLKYILSETKVLNLKQVKFPHRKANIEQEVKTLEFNLDWDYNKLLEKFENGTLRIEDIVKKKDIQDTIVHPEETRDENVFQEEETIRQASEIEKETEFETDDCDEKKLNDILPVKILESEYQQLCVLAKRPVRRAVSPELVDKCPPKYADAYECHNIEKQILQPSDAFRCEKVINLDEVNLSDCVDLDRCVLYDIIPPSSNFRRILSNEEKLKLLTLENFDNLSLAARYYVLNNHVNDLERYVESIPNNKLTEKDKYGRTPVQTLEIYKKLRQAVSNRIQEIKNSLDLGLDT